MSVVRVFNSSEKANDFLRNVIQEAVDGSEGDRFTVALSGGSMVNVLSQVLPTVKTEWKKWLFFFADERIVSFEDKNSTFGAYKKQLAPELPITLSQFVTINPSLTGNDCAFDYTSKLQQLCPVAGDKLLPRFDILFLGMGPDGHTCSLFPGHPLNKETSQWVAFIGDSPKPPPNRVTFTFPVINNAKIVVFVVTGSEKANVLKEILVDKKTLPAGMVQPVEGVTYWIVSDDAAVYIPDEIAQREY
ncbi:6-phosphogluconolactonase-like protein [Dinothrombium tinctorium]|uniref:6-phosphogluconolactonase n=1 Tax=Dinothrombium tinctorium TaxID=1965070 RepID=A0A443R3C5_9ACAR|nr:6-phosphogluconolactonase-like protein [Dinothrombium tinctorium]